MTKQMYDEIRETNLHISTVQQLTYKANWVFSIQTLPLINRFIMTILMMTSDICTAYCNFGMCSFSCTGTDERRSRIKDADVESKGSQRNAGSGGEFLHRQILWLDSSISLLSKFLNQGQHCLISSMTHQILSTELQINQVLVHVSQVRPFSCLSLQLSKQLLWRVLILSSTSNCLPPIIKYSICLSDLESTFCYSEKF